MNIFVNFIMFCVSVVAKLAVLGLALSYGFNTFVATTFGIATISLPVAIAIMVITVIPFVPRIISVYLQNIPEHLQNEVSKEQEPLVSLLAVCFVSIIYALTFYILSLFM